MPAEVRLVVIRSKEAALEGDLAEPTAFLIHESDFRLVAQLEDVFHHSADPRNVDDIGPISLPRADPCGLIGDDDARAARAQVMHHQELPEGIAGGLVDHHHDNGFSQNILTFRR